MTFDDGILKICEVKNTAKPGEKPVKQLKEKESTYFGYRDLGITRYYTALKADQKIDAVVDVPDWPDIRGTDICVMENGDQFTIKMIQKTKDEDDLKITRVSLERLGENYAVEA